MDARETPISHTRKPQMTSPWVPLETGKHQDHVIAHVVGATVLGYFEWDHAAHLLLDIGFIWKIYPDGDMGLLPQTMAIDELGLDPETKGALLDDVQHLHDGRATSADSIIQAAPAGCLIEEVGFFAQSAWRRVLLTAEAFDLAIDSSLDTERINFLPIPK